MRASCSLIDFIMMLDTREQLDRIQRKLKGESELLSFEELKELERSLGQELGEEVSALLERYQRVAIGYLRKLVSKADTPKESQTKRVVSYFFEESLKIANTKYFPYFNALLELNFLDFLSKLQGGEQQLASEFEQLIRDNELCQLECLGCNRFYYQFFPLELKTRKRSYELIFLNSRERRLNALAEPHLLQARKKTEIDLHCLQQSMTLLKKVKFALNNNGGFIVVGCKSIDEFTAIRHSYVPPQLSTRFIDTQLVVGQALTPKDKDRIQEGLHKLITRVIPPISPEANVALSFLPVRPSLFELGFGLEAVKASQRGELCLVVIKVHPTEEYYDYRMGEGLECEETDYDQHLQYVLREGSGEEREGASEEEAFFSQPQVSYFQTHTDCLFRPYPD